MLGARMLMSAARRHAYRDVVLADSPIGYWRLDETSGTIAADASGNGLDGTYIGGPTLGQLPLINTGNSVSFDGTDDYIEVSSASLIITGDVSVELWMHPDSLSTLQTWVMFAHSATGDPESDNALYSVRTNGADLDTFWEYGDGNNEVVSSANNLSVGTDYSILVTRDNTAKEVKFYVNGSLIATKSYTNSPTGGSAGTLKIGQWSDGQFANGLIDEVAIYNAVLSHSRASAHYNAGVGV